MADGLAANPPEAHVCGVCSRRLHYVENSDGTEGWTHPGADDHVIVPVPESAGGIRVTLVCDYCSAPAPTWRFRGRPITTSVVAEAGSTTLREDGVWLCCDGCRPFVLRLDANGLAQRVARAMAVLHPEAMGSDAQRAVVRRMLREQYATSLRGLDRGERITA